jgi:hypothetical protein
MRQLMWSLAALAVASLGGVGFAEDSNQALADAVAREIQSSRAARGYHLDIETLDGTVTVSGEVSRQADRDAVVDLIRGHEGVRSVRDKITVRDGSARAVVGFDGAPAIPSASAEGPVQQVVEPEPVMDYAGGIAPFSDAPALPPYAWPSYTPYNNFASVAYQTQYPSGAWPFIGPPYPYPMIPSGWRRVSLTWKKGYWWMKFHAHGCH